VAIPLKPDPRRNLLLNLAMLHLFERFAPRGNLEHPTRGEIQGTKKCALRAPKSDPSDFCQNLPMALHWESSSERINVPPGLHSPLSPAPDSTSSYPRRRADTGYALLKPPR